MSLWVAYDPPGISSYSMNVPTVPSTGRSRCLCMHTCTHSLYTCLYMHGHLYIHEISLNALNLHQEMIYSVYILCIIYSILYYCCSLCVIASGTLNRLDLVFFKPHWNQLTLVESIFLGSNRQVQGAPLHKSLDANAAHRLVVQNLMQYLFWEISGNDVSAKTEQLLST